MSKPQMVTVFGGTGFVGRYLVQELVKAGYHVQVFARHVQRAARMQPLGYQNKVIYRYGDLANPRSFQEYIPGSFAVINAVGILYERRKQRFSSVHAQYPERLAKIAKDAGVKHFIHISAIGADQAVQSVYARSKGTGEKAVLAAFPEAIICRPSIIFGPEDNFFNKFASMASISPFLPLIGGGNTRFQPVYVADLAKAVVAAIHTPALRGRILEFGGSEILTFRQILEYILRVIGKHRILIPVPWALAKLIGLFFELLPRPLLTRDQVKLLKHDNLVQADRDGFAALNMTPTTIEMAVPSYLERFRSGLSAEQSLSPATS